MQIKTKRFEQQIKVTQNKYQLIYDSSPDMYVSVDPASAIIKDCNQTLANKTGYKKEEIIGQPVFLCTTPTVYRK